MNLNIRLNRNEIIWLAIFSISILFTAFRSAAAISTHGLRGVIATVLILIMMYWIFLLEGLLFVLTQLRLAGVEGASSFIRHEHFSERHQNQAVEIIEVANSDRFDSFVDGRQILVMILVVSITALFVDDMDIQRTLPIFTFSDHNLVFWPEHNNAQNIINSAWKHLGDLIFSIVVSKFLSGLFIALLPVWVSQLFPQHVAKDHSFEFLRLLGAPELTCLSLWIARAGTGWPGHMLVRLSKALGTFNAPEKIKIGYSKIIEDQIRTSAFFAETREITIKISATGCHIIDSTNMGFYNAFTSHFWNSLRLFQPEGEAVTDSNFFFPEPCYPDGVPAVFQVTVAELQKKEDGNIVGQELFKDVVVATKVSLSPPMPLHPKAALSHGRLQSEYDAKRPKLGPDETDIIYLDVSLPTRKMIIHVIRENNLRIMLAEAVVQRTIALLRLAQEMPLDDVKISKTVDGDRNHHIQIDYPPTGSQAIVTLDIRPDRS